VEDVGSRWWLLWLPPVSWAAGLLLLSSLPGDRLPSPGWWQIDKLAPALLYAMLGGLTGRAATARGAAGPGRRCVLVAAALGLAGFGVLDEWSQSLTPGRMPSAADAVADAIGAWTGLFAASRYYRRHAAHPQLRR